MGKNIIFKISNWVYFMFLYWVSYYIMEDENTVKIKNKNHDFNDITDLTLILRVSQLISYITGSGTL